jgi:hypothetical protein
MDKDEIRPVDPAYEPALGIDNWSRWDSSYEAPEYRKVSAPEIVLPVVV